MFITSLYLHIFGEVTPFLPCNNNNNKNLLIVLFFLLDYLWVLWILDPEDMNQLQTQMHWPHYKVAQ